MCMTLSNELRCVLRNEKVKEKLQEIFKEFYFDYQEFPNVSEIVAPKILELLIENGFNVRFGYVFMVDKKPVHHKYCIVRNRNEEVIIDYNRVIFEEARNWYEYLDMIIHDISLSPNPIINKKDPNYGNYVYH